jgi:hypothetical protein
MLSPNEKRLIELVPEIMPHMMLDDAFKLIIKRLEDLLKQLETAKDND